MNNVRLIAQYSLSSKENIPAFKNCLARGVHAAGYYMTVPFTKGARVCAELFSHQALSDKIAAFALLIILLLASPLAIPGFLLRFSMKFVRNPLDLCHGDNASGTQASSTLKVMSWNIAFGPGFMAAFNKLSTPKSRVEGIANMVVENGIDIACFQEAFDESASSELAENLMKKGYTTIHGVISTADGLGRASLSSGLFIAIKGSAGITLTEISLWKYENGAASDQFSNKGLIHVKFDRGGKTYNLFNTHLQASYGNDGYSHIREEQVQGLCDAADNVGGGSKILCGDLNYAKKKLEPGDKDEEYESHKTHLGRHFKDPNERAQDNEHGTFIDLHQGGIRVKSTVDYILVSKDRTATTKVVELDSSAPLSDHLPLICTIS
jgi:endonuclease/exonuclease/phosphatase family metal-dependent hydrolase